jgi:hypothetical protein
VVEDNREDPEVSVAGLELLADLDDDAAHSALAKAASSDDRNAVRHRARELAEKEGAGNQIKS